MKRTNHSPSTGLIGSLAMLCLAMVLLVAGFISAKDGDKNLPVTGAEAGVTAVDSVSFDAQYIRTDGYHEDVEYPVVKVIRSVEELNAYYNATKDKYDLERKDKVYSDTTIGFLDACDKYDAAYFEDKILVMVLLEEGSGSIRHEVKSFGMGEDGKCHISIDSIVPEAGTADMAEWHILIEPAEGTIVTESDVAVYIDGINPLTQDKRAQHARGYANIFLDIPYDWEYETESADGKNDFCISFWPSGKTKGKISVWYYEAFGVCGTGLKEEKIKLGKYEAYRGTYEGDKLWDFISFRGLAGSYVVINEGAEAWWEDYGEEAMEILETLTLAEDIITEAEAIRIARESTDTSFDTARATFDSASGIWTVTLSNENAQGSIYVCNITSEGKVLDIAIGDGKENE